MGSAESGAVSMALFYRRWLTCLGLEFRHLCCLSCDFGLPTLDRHATVQYMCQCVSFLTWLASFLLLSLVSFLCIYFPFSSLRPRTQLFPTECSAEGWAFVSCCREGGGGGRLTSWLPTRGLCLCERKQGRQIWWWQNSSQYPRDSAQLEEMWWCFTFGQ